MDGEHERLKQYFTEVVELDPGAREARLVEIKDIDAELYVQLLRLLEQDEHSTRELFDSGEIGHAFSPESSLHHDAIPETIGSYKVIRLLGRGATSRVFEVEQNQPRRRIALKLLDDEVSSNASYSRFSREIEALARMNHDGIAQVYEGGAEEIDGRRRPFFTMELVEGKPITRYAQEAGLSKAEKLGLITRVAEAAHHAHLRGVIHRDLKPSNILVTEGGRPVVLDFGVAKLLTPDTDTPSAQTETGRIIGTLAYMSPEQARASAGAIDLRSDVYSIGAIAYELFAGEVPLKTQDIPLHLALLAIQTDIPPGLGSEDHSLRGDISTIVSCSLEKDPDDRYQSADEFAADIRRHLGSEAIRIVPTPRVVRFKKFARRNRLPLASASAIAIALVSGATVAAWQASVATNRLTDLERTTEDLQLVTEFQSEMLRASSAASIGGTAIGGMRDQITNSVSDEDIDAVLSDFEAVATYVNRADLGRSILEEELLKPASVAISNQFEDNPKLEAVLRMDLARVYFSLDSGVQSTEQAQLAYEIARAQIDVADIEIVSYVDQYAQSLASIAKITDAIIPVEQVLGERRAIGVLEDEGTLLQMLGFLYFSRAVVENNDALYDVAEAYYVDALDSRRLEYGVDGLKTIDTEQKLGLFYSVTRQFDRTEELYKHSLRVASERLDKDDEYLHLYRMRVASFYSVQGKYSEAEPIYRDVYQSQLDTLGEEHILTRQSATALAYMLYQLKRYNETESIVSGLYDLELRILGPDNRLVYERLGSLAKLLSTRGQFAEAAELYEEVVAGLMRISGPEYQLTIKAETSRARNLHLLGRHQEAEHLLLELLSRVRRILGDRHHNTMFALRDLADCYADESRYAEAEPLYAEMMNVIHSVWPNGHMFEAEGREAYGSCLLELGKYDEARHELEIASKMYADYLGQESDFVQQINNQLQQIDAYTSN